MKVMKSARNYFDCQVVFLIDTLGKKLQMELIFAN